VNAQNTTGTESACRVFILEERLNVSTVISPASVGVMKATLSQGLLRTESTFACANLELHQEPREENAAYYRDLVRGPQ
jgi:hypothetical protein